MVKTILIKIQRLYETTFKIKKKVGIYWFSYAYTEEMARKEANYCLNAIKNYDIDYPIFLTGNMIVIIMH